MKKIFPKKGPFSTLSPCAIIVKKKTHKTVFWANQCFLFASGWPINWTADRNKQLKLLEFGGARF